MLEGDLGVETRMKTITIIVSFLACLMIHANALAFDYVQCSTDKKEYVQGEKVFIKVKNNSKDDILVVNGDNIDGGFATIERRGRDGKWKPIELITAANVTTFKILNKGDTHTYRWKTKGYNRSDTLADPGTYRVIFSNGIQTNEFVILGSKSQ